MNTVRSNKFNRDLTRSDSAKSRTCRYRAARRLKNVERGR